MEWRVDEGDGFVTVRAATPRENTSTEPPKLFDFWYNIHCQNGNVTGLIASRREPPRRGRQDRPSVANRYS